MSLGKKRRDTPMPYFHDVAYGGRQTAAKHRRGYKHAQIRRDRLEKRAIIKTEKDIL